MNERYWYFKRCELFEQLDEARITWLESQCQQKTFAKNSLIYLPEDQSDSVLLLVSGRVRLYHITSEGKEALLAFIEPGELFGELAAIQAGVREEFAETMEKSQVVRIPRSVLEELMTEVPQVTLQVARLIGTRRQVFERRLKSLMFQSNREKLIHLLLELSERYGCPHPEGIELKIKLSHQEMANLIGSTRETVTVVLQELQRSKLVITRRRQVILANPAGLAGET